MQITPGDAKAMLLEEEAAAAAASACHEVD
jgi:hypothetical protein